VDRNTAVLVLVVVVALGLGLAAVSSSTSLNREVVGNRREQEKQVEAPASPPAPPPDPEPPPPPPPAADPGTATPRTPEGPPTLEDVGRELALSAEQRDRVAKISDGLKQEVFDLMRLPRADGGSLADELLKARAAGDAAAWKSLMERAAAEKIPGTTMTYLEGKRAARDRASVRLLEELGEEYFARFRGLKADLELLETGFDPWRAALDAASK
jgi:hypothetical protein